MAKELRMVQFWTFPLVQI